MRIDPIRQLIEMVECTETDCVKKIAQIAKLNFDSYKNADLISGMTLYVFDVTNGLVSLQNGTHTRYSEALEHDARKVARVIFDNAFEEHKGLLNAQLLRDAGTSKDEAQGIIEAGKETLFENVLNAILDHYRTEYRGNDDYVPLDDIPIVSWALQEGSLVGRLELFKNVYFFSLTSNNTRH